jgi:hypothetical protein
MWKKTAADPHKVIHSGQAECPPSPKAAMLIRDYRPFLLLTATGRNAAGARTIPCRSDIPCRWFTDGTGVQPRLDW